MKIKINPYIYTLIKENGIFISAAILLTILIIFLIWLGITKNEDFNKKVANLSTEVKTLKYKSSLINSTLSETVSLDEDLQLLNRLVPETEDYFSIIYALDQLSQKTGFMINSYTINLTKSTPNKIQISIAGIGDSSTFLQFLKDYNYGGGRLITSDKIELVPSESDTIKINVAFYNKKTTTSKNIKPSFNNKLLTEIAALKNKVQFVFKESSPEGELDTSYPRKGNPF